MTRPFNFSPGPSTLPLSVLGKIRDAIPDWQGLGYTVMEASHRSQAFIDLVEKVEQQWRELLAIPDDYHVLFMPGGATAQFAAVPMNLLRSKTKAAYVNTGYWSKKAIDEAKLYADVDVIATAMNQEPYCVPELDVKALNKDFSYLHLTSNSSIYGMQFDAFPECNVPLVADMSSDILSRELDISQFGLIYAGAQKNAGIAGLTVVIVRKELVDQPRDKTPSVLCYDQQAKKQSLLNTPDTFAFFVMNLVLDWIKEQGGVAAIDVLNQRKAGYIYDVIDSSNFYINPVEKTSRSLINIPFRLPTDELTALFLDEATQAGLLNLKGHRVLGGIRASLYNAMPEEGAQALAEFMKSFVQKNA